MIAVIEAPKRLEAFLEYLGNRDQQHSQVVQDFNQSQHFHMPNPFPSVDTDC